MYEKPDKADLLHLHENILVRWELAILGEELLLLGVEFLQNAYASISLVQGEWEMRHTLRSTLLRWAGSILGAAQRTFPTRRRCEPTGMMMGAKGSERYP